MADQIQILNLSWENSRATEKIHLQGVIYFSNLVLTDDAELTVLYLPHFGYITWIAPFLCRISKAAKWESKLEQLGLEETFVSVEKALFSTNLTLLWLDSTWLEA